MAVRGDARAGAETEETTLDQAHVISLIRRLLPSAATPSADAEAAGETLWDLSAAQEHVPLLLRNSLPRAAAAALLHDDPPASGRLQEELLGCLANLAACGFAQALADDPAVVLAVVGAGLCGSSDPAALAEACRCLRAAVSCRAGGEAWRAALHGTDGARERAVSLLGSALHAPAVRQSADLVSSLWLAGSSHERTALLNAGALPAALAALAALPRLGGGDVHAAADAAARCVEAIASDSAAVPGLAEALADGSLQAALLPLLAQAEAAALAASACIALASVMAALQEAAAAGDDEAAAVTATNAIVALLQGLAADGDALAAAQAIADDSGWVGGGDAAAQEAAAELLAVLRASTCDAPDG